MGRSPDAEFTGDVAANAGTGCRELVAIQAFAANGRKNCLFKSHVDRGEVVDSLQIRGGSEINLALRSKLLKQPFEGLGDAPRLNSKRHMHFAILLIAEAAGAGDAHGKVGMTFQAFAALLQEAGGVPTGKSLRIVEAVFALIGLGEN